MKLSAFVPLLAFVLLVLLFPLTFGQLMAASLIKLQLSAQTAVWLIFAIVLGGFVNIPVRRIPRGETAGIGPRDVFSAPWPGPAKENGETIIAVNAGGCLIPAGLALYELQQLGSPMTLLAALIAVAINVLVCYRVARPLAGVGIAMPGLLSPLVAAMLALVLAPQQAPPVAFIAGVMGPLIGADLLHLKEVEQSGARIASIGGAGTFDGIVLSGIVAAYLA